MGARHPGLIDFGQKVMALGRLLLDIPVAVAATVVDAAGRIEDLSDDQFIGIMVTFRGSTIKSLMQTPLKGQSLLRFHPLRKSPQRIRMKRLAA